jgi:predicted nuclease of restriction endonuclease-like (RecB) superfamily
MDGRKSMGKQKKGVIIPVAPALTEMGDSYRELFDSIKSKIGKTRLQTVISANTSMILLYWDVGNEILKKQSDEGWGAKVIDRLSKDLSDAFPDMKGFSPRNLKYMRKFAECWQTPSIVQQGVAQLSWRSNILLLDKLQDNEERLFYVRESLKYGWSSNILHLQLESQYMKRQGKSVNNFDISLPPEQSDMAAQIFKDPYLFDFLGTDAPRRETEVEKKLTEHIEKFLLELGQGFAFVGRQVHLELGGDDFYIDLLFYHLKLRRYVVIELKACEFNPGFVSQLSMYQNIVNDILNHPDDKPAIGLLLVKGKNKTVVEYSLAGYKNPIGVADWQDQLAKELPDDLKSSLPTIEEIEAEMSKKHEKTC